MLVDRIAYRCSLRSLLVDYNNVTGQTSYESFQSSTGRCGAQFPPLPAYNSVGEQRGNMKG